MNEMQSTTPSSTIYSIIIIEIIVLFVILAVKVGIALIPANIAKKKGYSFAGFFIMGIFFFLIGLIVSLCLDDKTVQPNDIIIQKSDNYNSSVADEIKKFKELMDNGVISSEEFEAKKKELLTR